MMPTALLFDQHVLPHTKGFDPFIYTDILAAYSGETNQTMFHFWEMENQVILGMQDTRVPFLQEGVTSIEQAGYHVVVRNSGGLAVVANPGVLNFSIILPQDAEVKGLSINNGYDYMKEIIEAALHDFDATIDAFEVADSYCPGDYDLSINGKKFAGIAQRRIKKGIGIMIYLSVHGDQTHRGQVVRDFYQVGLKEAFGTGAFPPVNPDSMANLNDLLKTNMTMTDMKQRLIHAIEERFTLSEEAQSSFDAFLTSPDFEEEYQRQYQRMSVRNDVINKET